MNKYISYLNVQILFHNVSQMFNMRHISLPFIVKKMDSLIGIDNVKQYYNVSDNYNSHIGILRPEMTYLAVQNMNLQKDSIYYYGYCFRRERTQYLRYKEFQQIGIELTSCNIKKHYIDTLLCILHLQYFLSKFHIKMKTIINVDNIHISEYIMLIFNKHFNNTEYNTLKRTGGDATYTWLSFEIHLYSEEKQTYYETIGGGCYKTSIGYGVGYACGIERICLLSNVICSSYIQNIDNIQKVYIPHMNINYSEVYDTLHKVIYEQNAQIDIVYDKRQRAKC